MLTSLSTTDEIGLRIKFLSVVCEFLNVFLEELSELCPMNEVEFQINLMPGAKPISIAPYHLALVELDELSVQIDVLMVKEFVWRSISS